MAVLSFVSLIALCSPQAEARADTIVLKNGRRIVVERATESDLQKLRDTLVQHHGNCPAFLHLLLPDRTEPIIALPPALRVAPSERLIEEIEGVLGHGVASFQ